MLKKYKPNEGIEFTPIYFNSVTKTAIIQRFRLENYFQEILYMIDLWINNGSGWNSESIEFQYIIISTYRPFSGSFYLDLPVEINQHQKQKSKIFLLYHVRHINPSKENPERIE